MKIASYNVENLFERAIALADADAAGSAAIIAQGEINVLLRKAKYEAPDRARILELLTQLGLRDDDEGGDLAMLRQNRGQLVRRSRNGSVEVVAHGRADWLGWVELKSQPVNELTTRNTARVIHEVDADIVGVVEAENRHSLRDFSRVMLRQVGGEPYANSMLIEGNDDRGINVGLMTKTGFVIDTVHTHILDLGANNQPIFSRDCAEYLVRSKAGTEVLVLVNHFKSKRGGGDARRLKQATRVKEIVNERLSEQPNIVVLGDLNDTPGSSNLAPLITGTPLKDISTSPAFDNDGFPGTFGTQGAANKIDYILLSPSLMDKVSRGGIFRKGVFSASDRWPMFDTITEKIEQASDHAAIWAEIDLP
ncbi:MAG TPA: endonuclease/exonuclease/phosphatase family protein [Solirubrobacteraceae bacterium]|jgi:endonuclease/exonuclease/phosphatase family metal-dependent hydrolase